MLFAKLGSLSSMQIMKPVIPPQYHFRMNSINLNETFQESIADVTRNNEDSRVADSADVGINQVKFEELVQATENFSEDNKLGKGGFGSVYKGTWRHLEVAIKRIIGQTEIPRDFLNELKYMNRFRHDNILALYGYSLNGNETCLVYQLMTGGTLHDRLYSKNTDRYPRLDWNERLNVMIGVANGLQFLHADKPLIHGDIKPANILLDKHLEPKLGDFGLGREGRSDEDVEISKVLGTRPYLPEDFIRKKSLSPKVDVFSYGCVLFEVASK